MATLLELKTRIRLETNKDDIASGGEAEAALTTAITQAIEYYSDRIFWFNQASGTVSTVASTATVSATSVSPAALRSINEVAYNGVKLGKVSLDEIQYLTETGQPYYWAGPGGSIRLHPIPNAVYSLSVYGLASTGIPAGDGLSNIWTTEAYDLIAARSRMLLYRDLWRDPEGASVAKIAEDEAFNRLQRETRIRGGSPLRSRGDEPFYPTRFDITRG